MAGEIVYRACEEPLSDNELRSLAESAKRLADKADTLPSRLKSSVDRAIGRILARMPPEIAAPIAVPWLEHSRKVRRKVAYRILRQSGVAAQSGGRLIAVFERTGDQDALKLIARNPAAVKSIDHRFLLERIEDEYWRMRVFQCLLSVDIDHAKSLAAGFPREFVSAAGRQRDVTLLPTLSSPLRSHQEDLDFVSLYAWSIGQLGARDELQRLRKLIGVVR